MKITTEDKVANNKLYTEYELLRMEDGWNAGDKDNNYRKLIKIKDLTGFPLFNAAVLDVGCGTGDLSAFLRTKNIGSYTGVDIYKPALSKAKIKYPKETFLEKDILSKSLQDQKFDFTFCSGALSTNLPSDNYSFAEAMLQEMWKMTGKGLAFNILSDDDKEPDPDLFFYNLKKIIKICKQVAPESKIHIEKNSLSFQTHIYMF